MTKKTESKSHVTEKGKNDHHDDIRTVRRGEIYFANLGEGVGSEQNGIRPVLIIQNDIGNKYSPTTIGALITSMSKKLDLPVHLEICKEESSLPQNSVVLLEQVRTIDKKRLIRKISKLNDTIMDDINDRIKISLGLN